MKNHYITIHWPPLPGIPNPGSERWIYLKRYRDLQAGDLALIYETKVNPRRKANGIEFPTHTGRGRGGIVAAVELNESPQLAPDIPENSGGRVTLTEELINDGRVIQWRYIASTTVIKEGFLGIPDIRRLLDKPRWNPRISGGITGISEADFGKLFEHIA